MIEQGADSNKMLVAAIETYNELLASKLKTFTSANTGVTAQIVDTSVAFKTAVADPTAFGATDATCYNEDGVSCVSHFTRAPCYLARNPLTKDSQNSSSGSITITQLSPSKSLSPHR